MEDKMKMSVEQLENVHGGTRPEEIGDPVPIQYGKGIIPSYRVCEKCGAAMFPVTVRVTGTNLNVPIIPDYQCSECENRTVTIRIANS